MSEHRVNVRWRRNTPDFAYETYDRTHVVRFDGGVEVKGSATAQYLGRAEHVNPEELLAAALSSCHMLTFLALAARGGLIVDGYDDAAVAILEKNEKGKLAVTRITLSPLVGFGGAQPDAEKVKALHDKAHANCMIANSLACRMVVEARF
ncbi:MAG: OsmC family protein [Planctomycetes bacterium]|nr:OsmC family protein [Planctomycetota bacterium]